MARDLYGRLKRLKTETRTRNAGGADQPGAARGPGAADSNAAAGNGSPVIPGLDGWTRVAPLVYVRESVVAVDRPPGSSMESRLLRRRVKAGDLCFMDTETTGLSGGAGTTVFLVGSGHLVDGGVRVRQTLLADFPGEPEFLTVIYEQLFGSPVWVSYNGKTFDSKLLETRFLMNGRMIQVPEQLDLLHWARRLWRSRIGPCGLDDVERGVLGFAREGDIPGMEIPDRYFDFLRAGDAAGLQPVFSHHLQDIVSLVALFSRLERDLESVAKNSPAEVPDLDRTLLGRYFAGLGDAGGERLLTAAVTNPREHELLHDRVRGAFALSRYLRARGRTAEMMRLWEQLAAEGSPVAAVEVAKVLEHRERNYVRAVEVVESLLEGAPDHETEERLRHRLNRLRRKLSR